MLKRLVGRAVTSRGLRGKGEAVSQTVATSETIWRVALAFAAVLLLRCTGPNPVGIELPAPSLQSEEAAGHSSLAANAVVDLSGPWIWTHLTVFVLPTEVAKAVVPAQSWDLLEGPVTRITCHVSGTMSLAQNGSAFSGTATQAASCETRTVPAFVPPPFVFQPAFTVDNGQVTGHAFQFSHVVEGEDACVNLGSARVVGGVAVGWRATGMCDIPIPDHPKVAKTTIWEATRP